MTRETENIFKNWISDKTQYNVVDEDEIEPMINILYGERKKVKCQHKSVDSFRQHLFYLNLGNKTVGYYKLNLWFG